MQPNHLEGCLPVNGKIPYQECRQGGAVGAEANHPPPPQLQTDVAMCTTSYHEKMSKI